MCRLVAYLGSEEATLHSVTMAPEHSLLVQSYAPREMMSGVVNADGFGAAWYVPWAGEEPAVYRSDRPMWADRSFAGISRKIRSRHLLAAVRSATPGLPAEESGVPPFASGRYAFAHNGAVADFRHRAMRPLRETLSDRAYSGLLGVTDSETIFAGLLDRLWEGRGLPEALAATARHVGAVCRGLGVRAGLNLAVSDGESMAFTRYGTGEPGNSLYFLEDGAAFPNAVVVASERLDDDAGWRGVPDRHLLSAEAGGGVTLHDLRAGP